MRAEERALSEKASCPCVQAYSDAVMELSEARIESSTTTVLLDLERKASEQASEKAAFERARRIELEKQLAVATGEAGHKVSPVELAEADYSLISGAVEASELDLEKKELVLRLGSSSHQRCLLRSKAGRTTARRIVDKWNRS